MKGAKLLVILQDFSKEEMKALKKVVLSPMHTTNTRLLKLYQILYAHHPIYLNTLDFKEKIFRKVFPKEKYNDQKLRRIFSQFRELVEQFLLTQHLQTNSYQKDKLLAAIYKKRNLYVLQEQKMEKLLKQIESHKYLDVHLLREKAFLMKEWCYVDKANFQKSLDYLKKFNQTLNHYYLAEHSLLELDFSIVEKTLGKGDNLPFYNFLPLMKQQLLHQVTPNLNLYFELTKLAKNQDEAIFLKAEQAYLQCYEHLTDQDRMVIFTHLTNFCTNQINQGKKTYSNRLMNLYQLGLEQKLLFNPNGQLDIVLYRNISMLAILNQEFEWATYFLNTYEEYLDKESGREMKNLCNGYLHFYRKEYETTIDLLYNLELQNINNILSAKELVLRSYFELFLTDRNYFSLFNSFAQSFIIYIKRKEIASSKGKRYINLIKFLRNVANKLYSIKDCSSLLKKWESDINTSKSIASKKWVLSKIKSFG